MKSTHPTWIERKSLFWVLGLLWVGFGSWILNTGHVESFRRLNSWHTPAADAVFKAITFLGDGFFIIGLAVLFLLLRRYQRAIGVVAGYLVSGLFAQLGKRLLSLPRPKAELQALGEKVYEVPGVDVHLHASFPSGHTTSAFALAVFLILVWPYRWYSWLLLAGAISVGYSRVYLSQHFPTDVWVGAMIGTLSGGLVFVVLKRYLQQFPEKKWLQ